EANRCLLCPRPRCREGCPAKNDIPGFISALLEGDPARGIRVLRRTNNFPGICGRVCDWANQCEGACILAQEGNEPVAIGALERFLADWELAEGRRQARAAAQKLPSGRRVAVVGSGPSGLAAAEDLALAGHRVVIYEELPIAGGALAWGIPTFRLPQHLLQAEIDYLDLLGVEFIFKTKVGRDVGLDELLEEYDAVFLGVGTTVAATPGLPGEDLKGVYTATEFLSRAKLSQLDSSLGYEPPEVGRRLAVFGAGNTAMDVAQTALRLGAESKEEITDVVHTALRMGTKEVTVVYRRSEAEMPARREEVASAREEGVKFRFLTAPVRFIGDERGHVRAVECIEMELGEPDPSGRRRPLPKSGSEFTLEVDTVVLALGYRADTAFIQDAKEIAADGGGLITIDKRTGRTNHKGIWAGGDIVSGPATVVGAMAAGTRAARDIGRHLKMR
ncbi:MAG: FAD-dependent oxidoreductase, partial [Candidatus Bipolaricaulia bacterium]